MAVTLTWSLTNDGASITTLDHGFRATGESSPVKTIFLEHNASNPLTRCTFYLSGASINEMIEWGDNTISDDFGGVMIHMNAIGSFPLTDWPVYNDKSPSGKDTHTFRTGHGETSTTGITLASSMGLETTGQLQPGNAPDISFQTRIVVPSSEGTTGVREFTQKLKFTYTS